MDLKDDLIDPVLIMRPKTARVNLAALLPVCRYEPTNNFFPNKLRLNLINFNSLNMGLNSYFFCRQYGALIKDYIV